MLDLPGVPGGGTLGKNSADLVILLDAHPRQEWLVAAVTKRLREELAKLRVQINEEKSRIVDLRRSESFGFLGFEYRLVRSLKGTWRPQYTPKLKKRTALLAKLREIFQRNTSQPVGKVIERINPILRGWVNYSAVGHSAWCLTFIRDWVEKKIRRHYDAGKKTQGIRLEAMESGVAVSSARARQWLPSTA